MLMCVAMTERWGLTDGWAGFVKGQGEEAIAKGLVAAPPGPRILVDGRNKDICECGSTFWITIAGKQHCMKCEKLRPA